MRSFGAYGSLYMPEGCLHVIFMTRSKIYMGLKCLMKWLAESQSILSQRLRNGKIGHWRPFIRFFMDTIQYKILEDNHVLNRAAYVDRGVEDVLMFCVDGLTDLKEAIGAAFPKAGVQRCIIHQLRNSFKYVSYKDIRPSPKTSRKFIQLQAKMPPWKD